MKFLAFVACFLVVASAFPAALQPASFIQNPTPQQEADQAIESPISDAPAGANADVHSEPDMGMPAGGDAPHGEVSMPQQEPPVTGTTEVREPVSEREAPKIEPAPDAPIMHTADWIHAIVLGPDEVPPKLPGAEEEEEEDIYGSGYGSGSGSGSEGSEGSEGSAADAAEEEAADEGTSLNGLAAAIAALSEKVDSIDSKLGGGDEAEAAADAGSAAGSGSGAAF